LKAVSSNRVIRVRLNCRTGYIRSVEVLGTAADGIEPLLTTAYPFPPPDDDIMTRPNFDGPFESCRTATVTAKCCSSVRTARGQRHRRVPTTITRNGHDFAKRQVQNSDGQ
jgi:hypothetical protein